MLSGLKRQGVVGKDGKIEIQATELVEGTVVEVIVLVEGVAKDHAPAQTPEQSTTTCDDAGQDTTDYLLSTEANRQHLILSIKQAEEEKNLISFTAQEWDEEYNVHF